MLSRFSRQATRSSERTGSWRGDSSCLHIMYMGARVPVPHSSLHGTCTARGQRALIADGASDAHRSACALASELRCAQPQACRGTVFVIRFSLPVGSSAWVGRALRATVPPVCTVYVEPMAGVYRWLTVVV